MFRILIMLCVLALPASALALSGVALTPDERDILVSKDIAGERWAITLSLAPDAPLQVTGNVFRTDGGEPAFVYCTPTRIEGSADDIANAIFHFQCFGNTSCRPGDCPSWGLIANDVTLPGSFFLPH